MEQEVERVAGGEEEGEVAGGEGEGEVAGLEVEGRPREACRGEDCSASASPTHNGMAPSSASPGSDHRQQG
jgi:hypothetical protein